jgi:sugar O-acyltransferase (sialic acid O-acetyltransferase NeuD family)
MKRLALLGASGHGKVVADIAGSIGWDQVMFFDDAWPSKERNGRWTVFGDTIALLEHLKDFDGVLVSIGDCAMRWQKHQALRASGAPLVTLIHPFAFVSSLTNIGVGSVVMAGAVVNVDVMGGEACIINTGATVDHDCVLGDAVHISPGAHLSGDVVVGSRSWVGVGSVVRQGICIGACATVGAGAVVVESVSDGRTVVGNPARPIALASK